MDPIEVLLRVTSWATLWCEDNDVHVDYDVISETECSALCAMLYVHCRLPYVHVTKAAHSEYQRTLISAHRNMVMATMNLDWLVSLLHPLVAHRDVAARHIVLHAPVDMSQWHPWRHSLEDTMYFDQSCYALGDREELCSVELEL